MRILHGELDYANTARICQNPGLAATSDLTQRLSEPGPFGKSITWIPTAPYLARLTVTLHGSDVPGRVMKRASL